MKKKVFYLLIVFILSFQCNSFCQYSEDGLYQNGFKNYYNHDWQYATVYLFALIQKSPKAFIDIPSFKKEVIDAFDYSMSQLKDQVDNSKKYLAQQSKPKPGDDTPSQAGLSSPPPHLRPANTVNLKKY